MGKVLFLVNNLSVEDILPFKGQVNVDISEVVAKKPEIVLVYDSSFYLPFWTYALEKAGWNFRYHIVIYFESQIGYPLRSHIGIGLYYRDDKAYKLVKNFRVPHSKCSFCGDYLKDWGGKKHLMHQEGSVVSDVWKHLNLKEKDIFSTRVPETLLDSIQKLVGDYQIVYARREVSRIFTEESAVYEENTLSEEWENKLIVGDIYENLRLLPTNSIDMIFVDPPYNLGKDYKNYNDVRSDYYDWTFKWFEECMRVLKPRGSLFYLNIPEHSHRILPQILSSYWIIDWIVWDNPGEPKGKLIPAHYSILWLSKSLKPYIYALPEEQDDMQFCNREKCRRQRRLLKIKDTCTIRNVRWDIHRIKHSSKRLDHPTQLPEKLLSFLIRLTTEEGDVVLDPMMGTGISVYTANKLNRKFIGIDLSHEYVLQAKLRLENKSPYIAEHSVKRQWIKKDIQIKVGELALKLQRLPTMQEIASYVKLPEEQLTMLFGSYSKVVKYAKIKIEEISKYEQGKDMERVS